MVERVRQKPRQFAFRHSLKKYNGFPGFVRVAPCPFRTARVGYGAIILNNAMPMPTVAAGMAFGIPRLRHIYCLE